MLLAPCCNSWFTCRVCHDAARSDGERDPNTGGTVLFLLAFGLPLALATPPLALAQGAPCNARRRLPGFCF